MVSAGLSAGLVDTFDAPLPAATITNSNLPAPTVTSGGPSGYFLRLVNDGVNSQSNRYAYDRTDAGVYQNVVARFDFAGYSLDQAADGFSAALIPTGTYGTTGAGAAFGANESPNAAGVLGLGFRAYPAGTNHVTLNWNNQELARYAVATGSVNFANGVWNQAVWSIDALGPGSQQKLDLIGNVNGTPTTVTVFNQYVFGAGPFENRVQFAGRTGGLNMNVDLDNVNVSYSNPTTAPGANPAGGPVGANTLFQDFDNYGTTPFALSPNTGSPGPHVLAGGPTGNYLRLIRQTGNLNNQIGFDRVAQGQFGRIEAKWDFNVLSGADGFAFALVNTGWNGTTGTGVATSGGWEEARIANALGLGFDIYVNAGDPGPYSVNLAWNGQNVTRTIPYDYRGAWHTASATIDFVAGGANVTLDLIDKATSTPHNIFTNYFIAGVTPYESRVVFGGRTGGATTNLDLDNIEVKWLDQIAQPTDPFHWRGITGDYGTNTLWTNDVLPGGGDNAVIDVGVATSGTRYINGTGSLTVTGTGGLNVSGNLEVASGAGQQGTLHLAGDSQTRSSTDFFVANGSGSTGTVTVADNARLTVGGQHTVIGRGGVGQMTQDGGTVSLRRLFVAEGAGSGGSSYTLNDGTLTASDQINIGRSHTATFTQTGGTVTANNDLYVRNKQDGGGSSTDPATYHMTGGTLNVNGTHTVVGRGGMGHFIQDGDSTVNVRRLFVAEFGGSDGSTYTLMDGTLNASMRVEVGRSAAATFTQTGGVFNAMGALEASPDNFSILIGRDVASTYNLEGGTLNARTIRKRADSTFKFTGGRLQADLIEFDLTNTSGTMAPGHSVGTTTVNGSYTQLAGGTLEMELTTGGNDLLVVNGRVNLDGELLLLAGYDVPENTRILLIDNISSDLTTGAFADLPEGTWFGVPGVTASFAITYQGGTGNDVELTAVPEPATMGLLALAAGALGGYIRRRRS